MLQTNWFYVAICFLIKVEVLTSDSVILNQERQDKEISKVEHTHNDKVKDNLLNKTEVINRFIELYPIESWTRHGFFSEDFLTMMNLHWLTFPPPDKVNHYVLAGLYIVIMLMGLSGNALVIFMYLRCKKLRTPANALIMNLAVSDFLMMSKMPIFIYNSIYLGPALGEYVCRYFGFIGGLSGTVSICTLAAISVDRFYVVKYPLNRRFTHLRVKICLALVWLYGVVFSIIPLLNIGLGTYVPEGYLTSCSFDYLTDSLYVKIFIFVFFVAAWVLPFILISYSYINILIVVIVSRNVIKSDPVGKESVKHVSEEEKSKQEMKLALIVLLVICMWFIAWTPYSVVALLGIAGRSDLIKPIGSMIPALFAKSASCVDPFIYAVTHPRFKSEIRALFFNQRGRRSNTVKVWSTQYENRPRRENSITKDDTIEEIVLSNVNTSLSRVPSRQKSSPELFDRSRIISKQNMEKKSSEFKPSWWYKPNFSNRSGSLKVIAKTLSKKKKQNENDESQEGHQSI